MIDTKYMNTQIIRYAKGHYGNTDDRFEDLKEIIKRWSGYGGQFNDKHVVCLVWDIWIKCAEKYQQERFMKEVLFDSWLYRDTEPIERMLSVMLGDLCSLSMKRIDGLGEYWLDLWFGSEDDRERVQKQILSWEQEDDARKSGS